MPHSYSILRVAGGDDPFSVLEAMVLHPDGQHLYLPKEFSGRRTFDQNKLVGEDKSLTKINGDWLDKWHHENPDYEIREHGHPERETPHFAGDDPDDLKPSDVITKSTEISTTNRPRTRSVISVSPSHVGLF